MQGYTFAFEFGKDMEAQRNIYSTHGFENEQ